LQLINPDWHVSWHIPDEHTLPDAHVTPALPPAQLPVAPQYVLQVSSPGERRLQTSADWRRFVGQWANVLSPEHGGRVEGRIMTVDEDAGSAGETVVLELENGTARRIPLAAIKEARLAFHL